MDFGCAKYAEPLLERLTASSAATSEWWYVLLDPTSPARDGLLRLDR
jgi:hypothetical protein